MSTYTAPLATRYAHRGRHQAARQPWPWSAVLAIVVAVVGAFLAILGIDFALDRPAPLELIRWIPEPPVTGGSPWLT